MSESLERKVRFTKTKKIMLASIASVPFLAVSLVAPGFLKILKSFGVDKKWKRNSKYYFWKSVKNLEKDGLVTICKEKGREIISITTKGRDFVTLYGIKNLKKKRWDGKWRVLIFDIPEKRRSIREKLRNTLAYVGFIKIQDSVWVYPYNCEDLVSLMKVDLQIGKELLYLIVEAMEGDSFLKKNFGVNF